MDKKCPYPKEYGDIICVDGMLWGLTYSECAPPDQRQCLGPCEFCSDQEPEETSEELLSRLCAEFIQSVKPEDFYKLSRREIEEKLGVKHA